MVLGFVDDKGVEAALRRIVTREGLTFVAVDTVLRARTAVKNLSPCVVLVDCLVPGAAEWCASLALRTHLKVASIPVRLLPEGGTIVHRELVGAEIIEQLVHEWCGSKLAAAK